MSQAITPIPLTNLKQDGKPCAIVGRDAIDSPTILAGKMKRPDTMHWSGYDNDRVTISGLWRGNPSYGEVVVNAAELQTILESNGFTKEAANLQRARTAWAKPLLATV